MAEHLMRTECENRFTILEEHDKHDYERMGRLDRTVHGENGDPGMVDDVRDLKKMAGRISKGITWIMIMLIGGMLTLFGKSLGEKILTKAGAAPVQVDSLKQNH